MLICTVLISKEVKCSWKLPCVMALGGLLVLHCTVISPCNPKHTSGRLTSDSLQGLQVVPMTILISVASENYLQGEEKLQFV